MEGHAETVSSEQLKKFYSGKSSKNTQHTSYNYYETESFEEEINEFISYSEVKTDIIQNEAEYQKKYKPWKEYSLNEKTEIIQSCCEHLDLLNEVDRTSAAKILTHIALGNHTDFKGNEDIQLFIENIKQNSVLLFNANTLQTIKQALSYVCCQLETSNISSSPESAAILCKEVDMYLTVLYSIISFNNIEEYQLTEFLFDLVVRLKDHFTKAFPIKKLMLTVYKTMRLSLGSLDESYLDLKSEIRSVCKLSSATDKLKMVKCTPEDLYSYVNQTSERYPTFSSIKIPENIANPLTAIPSTNLLKAMGLSKASKNVDLPYQTLFPSKNQQQQQNSNNNSNNGNNTNGNSPNNNDANNNNNNTNNNGNQGRSNSRQHPMEPNILPFTNSSPIEPFSLIESSQIWLNHLYISVADFQTIYEREKAVHRWKIWKDANQGRCELDEWDDITLNNLEEDGRRKMRHIENLYTTIVPNFQSIVVVILKLLLSTVSVGKDKEAEILEDVNITRNRESISKAVTGLLLLLLKWFKTSHVLKFEYLSQVLVDSGCMLLILKLLGLQEVALLASKKTDEESLSFLAFVKQQKCEDEDDEKPYTNKRNLFWSINLLRILQMLTKKKPHRILLLVQYKSSAILKRLLKVGHPVLDLYVLKNLKNQIPYIGRKWRTGNMKTISAIYSQCLTTLNDDWLSSPESSNDVEEHIVKEVNLRMLTRNYVGHRYLPNILPAMDEISGPDNTLFYVGNEYLNSSNYKYTLEKNGKKLPEYLLDEPILMDDIEFDLDFKRDYRTWLEKDVYSVSSEEDVEDDFESKSDENSSLDHKEGYIHDWDIGTPIPNKNHVPISAEDLINEINKLYIEEFHNEFNKEKKIETPIEPVEEDGWDKPVTLNDNSWGIPNKAFDNDEVNDFDSDEVEPEFNPLQGINWNEMTEDDLKRRLEVVEEKTAKRWLNVDMNDPRYMKVLNTFEGEILEDDEGWPI